MENTLISFTQEIYNTREAIPLHVPTFFRNEKKYLIDAIDSTAKAVAIVNGSAAHCIDKESKQVIRALVPMHTFGHPVMDLS